MGDFMSSDTMRLVHGFTGPALIALLAIAIMECTGDDAAQFTARRHAEGVAAMLMSIYLLVCGMNGVPRAHLFFTGYCAYRLWATLGAPATWPWSSAVHMRGLFAAYVAFALVVWVAGIETRFVTTAMTFHVAISHIVFAEQ
jgi:hypothetical protein